MRYALVIAGLLVIGAASAVGYLYFSTTDRDTPVLRFLQAQIGALTEAAQDNRGAVRKELPPPEAAAPPLEPAAPRGPDGPVRFELPLDCTPGQDCLVQAYVDMLAGDGNRDYRCGVLSYDGHKGTDIRLSGYRAMEAGVTVRAAAAGTVERIRDGMPDVSYRLVRRAALEERGLGNVVLIRHRDGYLTAYGHLRRGSILVEQGMEVAAGQPIALVGMSGISEYPHLHFEVRRDDQVLDPFTGLPSESMCGVVDEPLWSDRALEALRYVPTAVIHIGFAERSLNRAAIEYGLFPPEDAFTTDIDALLLHVYLAGVHTGDIAKFTIVDPAGAPVAEVERVAEQDAAVQLMRGGVAGRVGTWLPGEYRGVFTLVRTADGEPMIVLEAERTVRIR